MEISLSIDDKEDNLIFDDIVKDPDDRSIAQVNATKVVKVQILPILKINIEEARRMGRMERCRMETTRLHGN